jgi:hypothetical protein
LDKFRRSVRVEIRSKVLFRDEAGCLAKDCSAGAGIQLWVGGDGECLDDPSAELSPKLDMSAALGMNREAKPSEDGGDLCAR